MATLKMPTMLCRVRRYLAHRRRLGFALHSARGLLLDFAHFADRRAPGEPLTCNLILRWSTWPKSDRRTYHAVRFATVRAFARYCATLDPRTEIPPPQLLGSVYQRRKPHVFSPRQIRLMLERARRLSARCSPLRPLTFQTLFGLMACTGLRRCEALRLRLGDLDAAAGTLRVPGAKSSPPRLLPIHPTTVHALVRYRRARQRVFPLTEHFFVGRTGRPIHPTLVDWNFRQLVHGIVPTGDRTAVRLVDLRHTFATRLISRWSRQAQPVAHHLLLLARYMGHQNFRSTWWYVSADPQALAIAARRFQRYHRRREAGAA